jgi:poly-gamma-glutamate capsule biosynthesis protein CapA/YwtB (metallophosphatase superfamily)
MDAGHLRRTAMLATVAALVAGCLSPSVMPAPTASPVTPTASPSIAPGPTATAVALPASFPLAVVTGLTNLKSATTVDEVTKLAASGDLVMPCGIDVFTPTLATPATCLPASQIAAAIEANQSLVALLPPGVVEPATKTLPIDGDGPFGLFGADLFGDPASRGKPYPIVARATDPTLPLAWVTYDPAQVWTLASIGDTCPDAAVAYQAVALRRGWDWVFDGGTARYGGKPFLNPSPPAGVSRELIVSPVATGHVGTVAKLLSGADLTIADVECPIVASSIFKPNYGGTVLQFSISSDVLPLWRDKLGIDLAYLASNHLSDKGSAGIRSTLRLLDQFGIEPTGLGLTGDQALEPAYVERSGVKVAFVAWNDIPGVVEAGTNNAGVAWLRKANVIESVKRARAGGAQVVICDPQWWGGAEYHSDLKPKQLEQLAWFDEAGCDHVIGAGTHLAGPMVLRRRGGAAGVVIASEGNYMFGQAWWQDTQEGVITRLSFRGAALVNVRLDPYVLIRNAQVNLTDPEGDGHYVLQRVWQNSETGYLP